MAFIVLPVEWVVCVCVCSRVQEDYPAQHGAELLCQSPEVPRLQQRRQIAVDVLIPDPFDFPAARRHTKPQNRPQPKSLKP